MAKPRGSHLGFTQSHQLKAEKVTMRRSFSSISLLLAVLLLGLSAQAQEKIKLRVSSATKTLGYGPLWVAANMGFFERQNLDVDLIVIRASDVGIQALAGGSLEIAG